MSYTVSAVYCGVYLCFMSFLQVSPFLVFNQYHSSDRAIRRAYCISTINYVQHTLIVVTYLKADLFYDITDLDVTYRTLPWKRHQMETFSALLAIWREFTGPR